MLPFCRADVRMAPAGVRAIGSAMVDAGFPKTRIVLQQWNRKFRPSQMRLDGRLPDVFMISSMQLHSAAREALIRDACKNRPCASAVDHRRGPKAVYEPWDAFSSDPRDPWAADVAVTGEEYVLLNLLEVLLSIRADKESLRNTFVRARVAGLSTAFPAWCTPEPTMPVSPKSSSTPVCSVSWAISTNCLTQFWATSCLKRQARGQRLGAVRSRPIASGSTARSPRWS